MVDRYLDPFGGTTDENPHDFLRGFLREVAFAKDETKLAQFENFLVSNSDADEWFSNLAASNKDSWPHLKSAFLERYPKAVKARKSAVEYEEELLEAVLKEEMLGLKVQSGGVEKWSHVAWIEEVLQIARAANIVSGTQYVSTVRKRMPELLRQKVAAEHADWNAFANAVRDVDINFITEGAERSKRTAQTQREIEQRIRCLEQTSRATAARLETIVSRPRTFPERTAQVAQRLTRHATPPTQLISAIAPTGMYSVGAQPLHRCEPFLHSITLLSTDSNPITVNALFDDGAMISAMSTGVYEKLRDRLGGWRASQRQLRMADGSVVPSIARWEGTIILGSWQRRGQFEVFDSNGSWSFLFGKPLLQAFEAIHDYKRDVIQLPGPESCNELRNTAVAPPPMPRSSPAIRVHCKDYKWEAFNWNKRATLAGDLASPLREVQHLTDGVTSRTNADLSTSVPESVGPHPVCHITNDDASFLDHDEGTEIPVESLTSDPTTFCRASDPFDPKRVARVLQEVQIGHDLSPSEHRRVEALVSHFADCFALSVSEVLPIPDAVHRLNVPPNQSFPKHVHQRRLTPPQREYLNGKINEMLHADIIEPCNPGDVKCVSPTTLAQKAHSHGGLSREELLHRINDQCLAAGLSPIPDLPQRDITEASTIKHAAPNPSLQPSDVTMNGVPSQRGQRNTGSEVSTFLSSMKAFVWRWCHRSTRV